MSSDDPSNPTAPSASSRHVRGSSLLLLGRVIAMVVNFLVQVLIVRYLSTAAYGAFVYALSLVTLGETLVTLGIDRAVGRFLPIYQERAEWPKLFGTLALVAGTILSLGLAIIVLVIFRSNSKSLFSTLCGRPMGANTTFAPSDTK